MKKLIFACLLATTWASAKAEWTQIGETATGKLYIDIQSIRKDGNIRRVWQIQNFRQRDKHGRLSNQFRSEFNCKAETYRLIAFSTHSEIMATGDILMSDTSPSEWAAIPPRGFSEGILKIVCAE